MGWPLAIPGALLRAFHRARRQNLQRLASSIAFYALFSLPALLVVAIHVAGVAYGEAAARARLVEQVSRYLGSDLAATVDAVIAQAAASGTRDVLARAAAFVALFLGASLAFVELQEALNRIWGATAPRRWYVAVALKRLVSFGMALAAGAVLLASMTASVGIARFGGWLEERLPRDFALGMLRWLEPAVAVGTLAVQFLLIFKVLPDGRVPWKRAWVGAVVTAVLLVAAKAVVGRYLGLADVGSVYGAAGSLVVLLVWVYVSCVSVLLGGTFAFAWEEVRAAAHGEGGPEADALAPPS